jgi:hypothetical protein
MIDSERYYGSRYPLRRILANITQAGFTRPRYFRIVDRSYWHLFFLDVAQ